MELKGVPIAEERANFSESKSSTASPTTASWCSTTSSRSPPATRAPAEMLTHPPLFEHGRASQVMIVGGGTFHRRRGPKHKGVKQVVLVDIDGRSGALPRAFRRDQRRVQGQVLKIEIADAFEFRRPGVRPI
jgi:spermidine synthase